MKVLLKISNIIDTINRNIGKIASWILLPIILLTAFEVVCRYAFNRPTIWAWELIVQIWGLLLMSCGGYCYWKGSFVSVDVLYAKFPNKVKYILGMVTAVLAMVCMALIFKFGLTMFLTSLQRNERISSVWGSPMWTLRGWVPWGSALVFLQGVSEFIKNLEAFLGRIELKTGSDEIAEAIESVKSSEHLLSDNAEKEDLNK